MQPLNIDFTQYQPQPIPAIKTYKRIQPHRQRVTVTVSRFSNCGLHPSEYGLRPTQQTIQTRINANNERCDHGIMQAIRFMIAESVTDHTGFFTLVGGTGVGKTLALKTLTATACHAGVKAWYRSDKQVLLDSILNRDKAAQQRAIQQLRTVPILCVDEWCSWSANQMAELWTAVLDYCEANANTQNLLTAFAMNNPPGRWGKSEKFDVGKIGSRMMDGSNNRQWPQKWTGNEPAFIKENGGRLIDGQIIYTVPAYIDMKKYNITDYRPMLNRES